LEAIIRCDLQVDGQHVIAMLTAKGAALGEWRRDAGCWGAEESVREMLTGGEVA